jgi:hypothetical protein
MTRPAELPAGDARPAGMHALRRLGRPLTACVVIATALFLPGLALADTGVAFDCAPSLPLEKAVASAGLVFLGTGSETSSDRRSATVTVTEVWKGEVPSPVTVNGGPDPASAAEDDRTFDVGVTYLFVPVQVDGLSDGFIVDSACSSTVPWTEDLAWLRPPEVGRPLTGSGSRGGPFAALGWLVMPLTTAGLIGGGAFVLALFVARRRDA